MGNKGLGMESAMSNNLNEISGMQDFNNDEENDMDLDDEGVLERIDLWRGEMGEADENVKNMEEAILSALELKMGGLDELKEEVENRIEVLDTVDTQKEKFKGYFKRCKNFDGIVVDEELLEKIEVLKKELHTLIRSFVRIKNSFTMMQGALDETIGHEKKLKSTLAKVYSWSNSPKKVQVLSKLLDDIEETAERVGLFDEQDRVIGEFLGKHLHRMIATLKKLIAESGGTVVPDRENNEEAVAYNSEGVKAEETKKEEKGDRRSSGGRKVERSRNDERKDRDRKRDGDSNRDRDKKKDGKKDRDDKKDGDRKQDKGDREKKRSGERRHSGGRERRSGERKDGDRDRKRSGERKSSSNRKHSGRDRDREGGKKDRDRDKKQSGERKHSGDHGRPSGGRRDRDRDRDRRGGRDGDRHKDRDRDRGRDRDSGGHHKDRGRDRDRDKHRDRDRDRDRGRDRHHSDHRHHRRKDDRHRTDRSDDRHKRDDRRGKRQEKGHDRKHRGDDKHRSSKPSEKNPFTDIERNGKKVYDECGIDHMYKYRLCPRCLYVCYKTSKVGDKHTCCKKCKKWFCHICLRCIEPGELECGEPGDGKCFPIWFHEEIRDENFEYRFPIQSAENAEFWYLGKRGKYNDEGDKPATPNVEDAEYLTKYVYEFKMESGKRNVKKKEEEKEDEIEDDEKIVVDDDAEIEPVEEDDIKEEAGEDSFLDNELDFFLEQTTVDF